MRREEIFALREQLERIANEHPKYDDAQWIRAAANLLKELEDA